MQQKFEAACAADTERFCPSDKADADALKACLLAHRAVVAEACMTLVDASE